MKKLFAVVAFVAFFASISAPTFAMNVNDQVVITLPDDKPKKAETKKKSEAKECCTTKTECTTAEKKACGDKDKK